LKTPVHAAPPRKAVIKPSPQAPTWTSWEIAGALLAAVVAHAYYFAWLDVPILHDAAGYVRAARDIARNGLFSKYELSDLRTYGWPLIINWLMQLSRWLGIPLRLLAFEFELALHLFACFWLRRALRLTALPPRVASILTLSVALNPLVLIFPSYLLTESCSISLTILFFSSCIWVLSPAGNSVLYGVTALGSFLLGFAVMVRPSNLSLVPVWVLTLGSLFLLHRPKFGRSLATAALAAVFASVPLIPQLVNNVRYYHAWTPLVATDFTAGARWLGIRCIKYAGAQIPSVNPQVFYDNPFGGVPDATTKYPIDWYSHNPGKGALTLGLHAFNLLDQDLPFPYNTDLTPFYYPAVSIMNLMVVACGLTGIVLARIPAAASCRQVLPLYLLAITALLSDLAMHIPYAAETRWGVGALMVLYGFAAWLVFVEMRGMRMIRISAILCGAVGFAAAGGVLSNWVRLQAPSIRASLDARRNQARLPEILSTVDRHGRFVSGELNNWTLMGAGVGPEGQASLFTARTPEFSAAIHPITLQKNVRYRVEFEARAPLGSVAELSVNLYGDRYDYSEQRSLFGAIPSEWAKYSAVWDSGNEAPLNAYLRFVTTSLTPIEIRNVTFVQVR
jgi:hypothetical protein